MKILHIISSLETGGAQKLVSDLLPLINKADNTVRLIVFHKTGSVLEKKLEDRGVEIISLNIATRSLAAVKMLKPYLKWADVTHAHLFPVNYLVAMANRSIGCPLVFTEHSTHNRRRDFRLLQPLEKLMYKQYAAIGCISEAVNTGLQQWIGKDIAAKRLVTIHNGIDSTLFEEGVKKSPSEIFGRDGIPVLMISRFTASKDHPTLLKAIARIKNPSVFAVLAGDGERKEEYQTLVKNLGIEDRVVFLGTRSDIPDLIKASAVGVQASNWEGFGLTAVEMMAGGLPVIASDVAGLGDVVKDAGLLFKNGDHESLADLIDRVTEDTVLYERLKESGKIRARQYSIEQTADSYLKLYREISNL